MLSAFILRLPDILQFIGLIAVLGAMGFAMWKGLRFYHRVTNRK